MLAARADEESGRKALAELCRTYWYPLYAFVRRSGHEPHDAEDLTQEFLFRLIDRGSLKSVAPERGRFRSFLLASLKNFLINEWTRAQRQKRGGGQRIVSLDEQTAEARYTCEPVDSVTPETLFERAWAEALLDRVLEQVEREHRDAGKDDLFRELKPFLCGEKGSATYAEIARQFGITEGAVKMAVMRLRQRYAALLRAEIAQTVEGADEIEAEIRHLLACVSGRAGS